MTKSIQEMISLIDVIPDEPAKEGEFILPELIKAKILLIGKEEMVKIFLNAWNPILSLEFLTEKRLEDAIKYFNEFIVSSNISSK